MIRRSRRWASVVLAVTCALVPNYSWGGDPDTGNVVFFRGGFAGLTSNRANELFTDVRNTVGLNDGATGYYVGAGLDLVLTRDLWGMMSGVEADGEIGVEFKRFHSAKVLNTGNLGAGTAGGATALVAQNTTPNTAQITMLTVDVAPKLKFMEGSAFRPWIIPIGLDFHVISPPSNQTNYLDIGVQFGAGFEYQFWKKLKAGLDGRFHLATNQTNTVNNFGTIGPYVGIGF